MDRKLVLGSIGSIVKYLGLLMIVPVGVAIWYGECERSIIQTWLIPLAITIIAGLVLERKLGVREGEIKIRDGFAIVAFGWLAVAFFGALPYFFSSTLGIVDAFFESMSGFTTTGSTVIVNLDEVDRSILLWRSFTQWIGGMGVILLFIAILPTFGVAGSQLFNREFPGPMTERIRPRVQATARLLWSIYVILTGLQILALIFIAKMAPYYAICTAFSTISTGGFSPHPASIAGFQNPMAELIVLIFMVLAGMNFLLLYLMIRIKNPRQVLRDKEFQVYYVILFSAILIISVNLYIHGFYTDLADAFRFGAFQAVSIMTTAGFTTANFDKWPDLSRLILFSLMFIGGCGGSTGGGIKVIRIYVLLKYAEQKIRQTLYPHAVLVLKVGKKPISDEIIHGISAFFFVYIFIFIACSIAMTAMGLDMVSATSSVAATLGNVGPGFGLVAADFTAVPTVGKVILIFCMWIGRLELFTVLALLAPSFWKG